MQLLIYETAVPISSMRHAKACVAIVGNYAFSRSLNSVPLVAVEFPFAAPEYAIVFAGEKENLMPAAVLGMRDKENLFLDSTGTWQARYVPAFFRRYPFVFSNSTDGKTFTLCIDEAFAGYNEDGLGQRLFHNDGKPTQFTDNVMKFLQEYQRQFEITRAFCKKLVELDLLEPMQARASLTTGEKASLTGFMVVDRIKLKALSGEKLAELVKTDELELLYLHLFSMRNFSTVKDRLEGTKSAGLVT